MVAEVSNNLSKFTKNVISKIEDGETLEERAKEFFISEILGKFEKTGFNPVDIENLSEYISEINYIIKNRYVLEIGETVKSLHYVPTSYGKKWAES